MAALDPLITAAAKVDVIETAGRIIAHPHRLAPSATTAEVLALAHAVEKFWALAQAGEELARLLVERQQVFQGEWAEATSDDVDWMDARISALRDAIINQMAAIRGESEEENGNATR